jgi:hypothetical protein
MGLRYRCDAQNHQTKLNIAAKNIAMPITIERFTFVVRLRRFTSGSPELSFSIDMMMLKMDRSVHEQCPCALHF